MLYQRVAILIPWTDLAHFGSSSQQDRKALFVQALEQFNLRGMVLLADREYIGKEWFNFLSTNSIDFVIRSRDKNYFDLIDKQIEGFTLSDLIAKVRRSGKPNKAIKKPFRLTSGGAQLWLVIACNPCPDAKDKFMLLITSVDQTAYQTVHGYLKRWQIEHGLKQLKSNGFDLEKLNLGSTER